MNAQKIVNIIIWWGGIIAYGVWYNRKHPDAGFWEQLKDPWGWLVVFGLMILQAVVGFVFFRKRPEPPAEAPDA